MSRSNNANGKELLGVGRVTRGKSSFPFVFSLYFIMVCNSDPENHPLFIVACSKSRVQRVGERHRDTIFRETVKWNALSLQAGQKT